MNIKQFINRIYFGSREKKIEESVKHFDPKFHRIKTILENHIGIEIFNVWSHQGRLFIATELGEHPAEEFLRRAPLNRI